MFIKERRSHLYSSLLVVGLILTTMASLVPVVHAATATYTLNGTTASGATYAPNSSWTIGVSSDVPNAAFSLCGIHVNGTSTVTGCTPNFGTTNAQGSWSGSATFVSSDVGAWTEWIEFPSGTTSNKVSFTIASSSVPVPAPTATLTANGQASITVPPNTNVTYVWHSTDAATYAVNLQIYDPAGNPVAEDPCNHTNVSGPWSFIGGAGGSRVGTTATCQLGYRYVITYKATNTTGQASAAITVIVQDTATYTVNGTTASGATYVVGGPWNIALHANVPNTPFDLCGIHDHGNQKCTPWGSTNASGDWNSTGTFQNTDPGAWTEWIRLPSGTISNKISFTVEAQSATYTVNGTTASGATYTVGGPWNVAISSNIANSMFSMCGTHVNGTSTVQACTPNWGKTNANGSWTSTGTFQGFDVGAWTEWIEFPTGVTSSAVSFKVVPQSVAQSATYTVNGTTASGATYLVGDPYVTAISSNIASSTFSACWTHASATACYPNYGTTDAGGAWAEHGNFTSSTFAWLQAQGFTTSTLGLWTEWVKFPSGTSSNQVSFIIGPATSTTSTPPVCTTNCGGGNPTSTPLAATYTVNGTTISGATYLVGGPWTVAISSNIATSTFSMCGTHVNGTSTVDKCTPNWGTTDVNGSWMATGTFQSSDIGSWTEWVQFPSGATTTSNKVSFVVGPATTTPSSTIPVANLSLTKVADVTSTSIGNTVHYTLSVTALGPATSTGVVATDTLPTGLIFVSASSSAGSYASSTGAWTIGDMAPSSSATLVITTTVDPSAAGTTVTNAASVGESASSTNQNAAGSTATSAITVAPTVCTVNCGGGGGATTSTLAIAIAGLQGGATSTVTVSDLTKGTIVATSTANGAWSVVLPINDHFSVGATTTALGYAVATSTGCAGTFAVGASCAVTFTFTPGTNADIAVQKTVDNQNPKGGDTVNYTITVSALGPASSTFVVAHDLLPIGLSIVSATTSQGIYNSGTGDWNIGTLGPNATATLRMATLVDGRTAGTAIVNTASVSELSSLIDVNAANNSSTATILVQSSSTPLLANLSLTKVADVTSTSIGNTVHYTLSVTALGPATSTGVVATDTLPTGLIFVSASSSAGSYASSTGAWTIGDMAPSSTATLVITTTVDPSAAGTTVTNAASVGESASSTNQNAAGSTATSAITVAPTVCTVNCGGTPPVTPGGGGGGTVSVGGGGAAYSIAINGGALSTETTTVALSFYGSGAYTMAISNTLNFASSTWQPYVTTLPAWTLTSGLGAKTVYVKYRSVSGTDVGAAQASIALIAPGAKSAGQVLGASTSCGLYLNNYIKLGKKNDVAQVIKLQSFLNDYFGAGLPVTGYYGPQTFAAVNRFQLAYNKMILAPWVPYGLASDTESTGYVYKTTTWWINTIMCPQLGLQVPSLL